MGSARIAILPYLESWNGAQLSIRILLLPRGPDGPLVPLIPNGIGEPEAPSFATANFKLDVQLVSGLDGLPALQAGRVVSTVSLDSVGTAVKLFNDLEAQFTEIGLPINPDALPARPIRPTTAISVEKHLPLSYQRAASYVPGRGSELVHTDNTYSCTLKMSTQQNVFTKIDKPRNIAWGKLIATVLRNPKLAEAAGLLRICTIPLALDALKDGGFVYFTLSSTSQVPTLSVKTYAARIPILTGPRDLFTPVLFPILSGIPSPAPTPIPSSGDYGDIFAEATDYDDGWAKTVHGMQPQQMSPLKEQPDGTRPVQELGIRLGWDDVQVTIWMDRQLSIDDSKTKLDCPLGIQGYRVDVRSADTPSPWNSLTAVKGPSKVKSIEYGNPDEIIELGVEVHPTSQMEVDSSSYWVPMYLTSWSGPSLLTLDENRIKLAGGDLAKRTIPQEDRLAGIAPPDVDLQYGKSYEFRVRLMDHTGGGPKISSNPRNPGSSPTFKTPFRRWIRPLPPNLIGVIPSLILDDPNAECAPTNIQVQRGGLNYPAVNCTGYYNDPIKLLIQEQERNALLPETEEKTQPSLPDPDIDRVEITVLVSTLTQDPLAVDGTFMELYTTTRQLPTVDKETGVAPPLTISFSYIHNPNIFSDPVPWNTPAAGPVPIPESRTVRVRIGALGKEDSKNEYFGADDVRRGPVTVISLRKFSMTENALFSLDSQAHAFNAFFLQPDPPINPLSQEASKRAGNANQRPPDIISRLAAATSLRPNGPMTLRALPGRRVVMACSGAIRHTSGPDRASITFSSQSDLALHWIILIRLSIDRDWTWDGLAYNGIVVSRDGKEVLRFSPNHNVGTDAIVGGEPARNQTDLLIFDAIDPKPGVGEFPQELSPTYIVTWTHIGPPVDDKIEYKIRLPITTSPTQTPRIASVGIAMSPYVPSDDYSSTGVRRKALWIELAEPLLDPRDRYFARVLASSPDPLLNSIINVHPSQTPEPALAIDDEATRRIVIGQSNDSSGLDAMQQLIPSESPLHWSLPLPAGLDEKSAELFGFFTYELRVGHYGMSDQPKDRIWSTAQGRYGAPLRVAGVQHPAPPLICMARRVPDGIFVSAPYAVPLNSGVPLPRRERTTDIWILLYAQAMQIDGTQHRNVLLGRKMTTRKADKEVSQALVLSIPIEQSSTIRRYGTVVFNPKEIQNWLRGMAFAPGAPLSVLAVEMLPPRPTSGGDALGASLGEQRILRTSPLTKVESMC